MAPIKFPGLKEYEKRLSTLGKEGKAIAEKAVYAGAAIIADAVRANINALPAVKDEWGVVAYNNNWSAPLTETAKKGLQDGFGISPMGNEDGILNVKLGFDGYNDMKTKKYPKGQPNAIIARSLESGSSIAKKRPFVAPAVRKTKKAAEETMAKIIDEEIAKIMK